MPRARSISGACSTLLLSRSLRLSCRRNSCRSSRSNNMRRRSRCGERRKYLRTSTGFPFSFRAFKRSITGSAALMVSICNKPWYSVVFVSGLNICRISHRLTFAYDGNGEKIQEGFNPLMIYDQPVSNLLYKRKPNYQVSSKLIILNSMRR